MKKHKREQEVKKILNLFIALIVWIVFNTPNGGKVFIDPESVSAVRSIDGSHHSDNFSEVILYNNEKIIVTDPPKEVIKTFQKVLKK